MKIMTNGNRINLQLMAEIELALKWFEMNDISAYITDEDLYVEVNNDTTIHISNAEISYRADLYKQHYEN